MTIFWYFLLDLFWRPGCRWPAILGEALDLQVIRWDQAPFCQLWSWLCRTSKTRGCGKSSIPTSSCFQARPTSPSRQRRETLAPSAPSPATHASKGPESRDFSRPPCPAAHRLPLRLLQHRRCAHPFLQVSRRKEKRAPSPRTLWPSHIPT